MSVQVERLEHNMVKLTIEVSEDKLLEAMKHSYNRQKNSIRIDGFRKGKVPYAMVERMYGPEVFYDDAADELIEAEYPTAIEEFGEEVASVPSINVEQIEKGKPFIFTAEVAVKPPVELGKYEGVEVTKIDEEVTEEEIDAAVDEERENNARTVTVERAIKDGDTAVIDFTGYKDGEEFEGGKGEGYSLNIGSHSFVDTFEDQLIGHKAGEEVEVNVTFPEEYQSEELAGEDAMFKVVIHEVKERQLPEADDEFAQDVSEFDTLAEYRDSLKEKLLENKKTQGRINQEDEALKKIVEDSEMDVPDAMVETQVRQMMRDLEQNLVQTGISMPMYFQYTGTTEDEVRERFAEQAGEQIRTTLVVEAIAEDLKLEISDEEVDEELKKTAEQYDMDPKTLLEVTGDSEKDNIRRELRLRKAIDHVIDNAKQVKAKKASAKKSSVKKKDEEDTGKKETKKSTTKKTATKKTEDKADDKAEDKEKKTATKKTTKKKADEEKKED